MAKLLSRIFQIRDDILNPKAATYARNRPLVDMMEDKLSFPDIHRIQFDRSILGLLNIRKHRGEENRLSAFTFNAEALVDSSTAELCYSF
ncbi:hypothetical protein BP00DRAFT_454037 [Aspergillus indologenus CBS 114.80]|uniref:Uncharacterized protein n=1 Tax=Aspergillus indologenus CBS 114.80 TaxID=1450541 RepID=A0A2V5JGA4_9EURO|nr:hypothetical protein BP00DRAFT_454037 [Aspergillus indologenus CBS 114.80]